jgi:hypothetical protein
MTDWIAAAAEETGSSGFGRIRGRGLVEGSQSQNTFTTKDTEEHKGGQRQNPHFWQNRPDVGHPGWECGENEKDRDVWARLDELAALQRLDSWEEERERRIYRQRTVKMLRQEHDQAATARLLGCGERTVRRYAPIALDMLSEILLDVGLLERISPKREKSCQEGESDQNFVSDCETSKNKF